MKMSEHGCNLLTQWEGFKTRTYNDSAGLPTIGVGHLLTSNERASGRLVIGGQSVSYANGLTESQVRYLLAQDLQKFEKAVSDSVTAELDQNQFDAIVSFTFNVGIGAFKGSSVFRTLNQGNFAEIPDKLREWIYAGGKQVPGLMNRRENESKLWFGEI